MLQHVNAGQKAKQRKVLEQNSQNSGGKRQINKRRIKIKKTPLITIPIKYSNNKER